MSAGLLMFAALLVLLALRVHIGVAMFVIGSVGRAACAAALYRQ